MVFGLFVQKRVYNFFLLFPEQVVFFVICPKLGPKMKGAVLNRIGIFGLFLVLNRVRVSTLSGSPIPKHGSSASRGYEEVCYIKDLRNLDSTVI